MLEMCLQFVLKGILMKVIKLSFLLSIYVHTYIYIKYKLCFEGGFSLPIYTLIYVINKAMADMEYKY